MSLIDELRAVTQNMPPSHVPSQGELPGVVGALIAYVEDGDKFISAAGDEDPQKLVDLLSGTSEPAKPASTGKAN